MPNISIYQEVKKNIKITNIMHVNLKKPTEFLEDFCKRLDAEKPVKFWVIGGIADPKMGIKSLSYEWNKYSFNHSLPFLTVIIDDVGGTVETLHEAAMDMLTIMHVLRNSAKYLSSMNNRWEHFEEGLMNNQINIQGILMSKMFRDDSIEN